jgi:hypothetical protein
MVNAQLVKTLREKTLVVTDATAPLGLRKLFPGIKEVKFDVPENLKIAQATHAFLAARDLLNEKTVASLEACIEAFTGKEDKALALMPKAIYEDGALKLPENVTGGYWGRDERATNAFSGCNILFLLSHYLGPIDQIKAGLNAIKAFLREPLISEEEENDGWVWRFKPILHAPGQGGYTIGRWSRASADPELQEAIDQDHASHIIQAIGRLRAALRAAGDPPALVVIFSNDPVDGLPIDHVFKAKNGRELVGELGQYKADFEAEYQKMPLLVATPPSKADSFLNIVMKLPENGRGIERKVAFFDSGMRFILTRSCPKENLDPWLKVEAIYHLPPRSAPPLFQAAGATD